VVDTIARRNATIFTNDLEARFRAAKLIKTLYGTRSGLVHRGAREVSHSDVRSLESLMDILYLRILENVDPSTRFVDFENMLDRAGYGLPWPECP
jgi:hypothetical protein